MTYEILQWKTGTARRFYDLVEKANEKSALTQPDGFELSRSGAFVDGRVDILDILAYRNGLNGERND